MIPGDTAGVAGSFNSPRSSLLYAGYAAAVTLFLPIGLEALNFSATSKYLYPAATLMVAAFLKDRGSTWYIGLCIWSFCATPLIRRLNDFGLGFDPANPILLSPYLALLVSVPGFLSYISRPKIPFIAPFAIMLVLVGYGCGLAILNDRMVSGLIDGMKWGSGPLFCLALMQEGDRSEENIEVFSFALMSAGIMMSLYGLMQFISPNAWDVYWVNNVDLSSFGQPEPYGLRVFSSLNSPGPLGMFLSASILFLSSAPLVVSLIGMPVCILGLALTQYRTVWASALLGVMYIFLQGSIMQKARFALLAVVMVFSTGALSLLPEVNEVLEKRVQTFSELSSDESGEERLAQYARFASEMEQPLLGEGLALNSATRALDQQASTVIDGGILEILRSFGIPLGLTFVGCFIAIAFYAFRSKLQTRSVVVLRAIIIGAVIQIPFGTVNVGEQGILFWTSVGLLLGNGRDKDA